MSRKLHPEPKKPRPSAKLTELPSAAAHREAAQCEDDNVGVEAANRTTQAAEGGARYAAKLSTRPRHEVKPEPQGAKQQQKRGIKDAYTKARQGKSTTTASLYSSSKQLYFDMETGETYDGQGNYYNVTPIWRGGVVYVPVDFICQQYGLAWSYIEGSGYGDVLRIVDSDVHLTDAQFLTAAKQLMSSRYNAYVGNTSSEDPPIPGVDIDSDCVVWLSFEGVPSARLLDVLGEYGVKAGFFLTADELRANTATVRRIVGEGHSIGVLCHGQPLAEYLEFRELLYEAAHAVTVLIASGGEVYDELCRQAALENDLVFWDYDNDCIQEGAGLSYASLITAYLEYRPERLDTRILCTEMTDATLPSVLGYMPENNVTARAPNEVDAPTYD